MLTAIGITFAVAYVSAVTLFSHDAGRIVRGDTIQYYAYLRSLVLDRDVDFTNEYERLYPAANGEAGDDVWLTDQTGTGRPPNMMSIGPALLSAPFFLTTYAMLVLLRPLGVAIPLDGFAAPFPLSAGIAGITYATLGAYFGYRSCRLLFATAPAFWGSLVAWLATSAVYYSVISPAYSHASSLFATALFCYIWLKARGDDALRRYLWLGILAGVTALVRWQDAIILVLPLIELMESVTRRRQPLSAAVFRAGVMLCAVPVVLTPQLLAWHAIYGQVLVIPQGGDFMQWTAPALGSVLFSLRHGLFSWTPAVLVAVLGFYSLVRRDVQLGWSAVIVVLLATYINASVRDWWAGEAFGARRFIGCTVFFALGMAALFARDLWQRRPALLRWSAAVLVVYNLLFLLQYQLFMRGFRELAPYPTTIRQVFVDRLTLPWDLLRGWLKP